MSILLNSLQAWKAELQKKRRSLSAVHARATKMQHPEAGAYARLLSLNSYLTEIVQDAIDKAEKEPRT